MTEADGKNGGDTGVPTTVLTASISNIGNLSDPVDVIIEKLIRYVSFCGFSHSMHKQKTPLPYTLIDVQFTATVCEANVPGDK